MSNLPDHLNPTVLSLESTIAGMEKQIEKLKEERDEWKSYHDEVKSAYAAAYKERDEWRKCAERFHDQLRRVSGTLKISGQLHCNSHSWRVLFPEITETNHEYDRLTRSANAKGGRE